MLHRPIRLLASGLAVACLYGHAKAGAGTEGAAFLNIPAGAQPVAMGAAYTAQATNAYAPMWNPAGLAFARIPEITGMHTAYLDTLKYNSFGAAVPVDPYRALGLAIQYLGTGDLKETNQLGVETGRFSNYYAAYSLAYGQTLPVMDRKLALGATGKYVRAQLSDVSASAYGLDLGILYKASSKWQFGGTLANLGTSLTFLEQKDDLPLAFRMGTAYQPRSTLVFSAETVYRKTGLLSFHTGAAWRPLPLLALRLGYRTDTLRELSALAGFATGIGIQLLGQDFDYSWAPMGELGNAQYVSLIIRFGGKKDVSLRGLNIRAHHPMKQPDLFVPETTKESPLIARTDERLTGPAKTRPVLFQYQNPTARNVAVLGDFNRWTPQPMAKDETGLWMLVQDLPRGQYAYHFVVDGKITADPWNRFSQKSGASRGPRSVFTVADIAPVAAKPAGQASEPLNDPLELLGLLEDDPSSQKIRMSGMQGDRL